MRIIYASCLCRQERFFKLFSASGKLPGQQVQKYNRQLAEGLAHFADVHTVSAPPVTRENCAKVHLRGEKSEENGVHYHHLPVWNMPVVKNLFTVISAFRRTFKLAVKAGESVIICDVLNFSVSTGALLAAKLLGLRSVGIVTDIPSFLFGQKQGFQVKLNNKIIHWCGGYVLMTPEMNRLINKGGKPSVVIEGQVDTAMTDMHNELKDKDKKRICIYAGGLQKIYGIQKLTEAFIGAAVPDSELHIYGSGDYEDELKVVCAMNPQVKFLGTVPNRQVVEQEIKATLLVNPRPTNEEYTKYSFPSKNMEYMSSGTPLLTTKLPGMPKEYGKYVYLFHDESVQGMTKTLHDILTRPVEQLHSFGQKAKQWVLSEKNNVTQAEKIYNMIKRMY